MTQRLDYKQAAKACKISEVKLFALVREKKISIYPQGKFDVDEIKTSLAARSEKDRLFRMLETYAHSKKL